MIVIEKETAWEPQVGDILVITNITGGSRGRWYWKVRRLAQYERIDPLELAYKLRADIDRYIEEKLKLREGDESR